MKGNAARNVVVTIAAQMVSWALTFVVTLFVPRYVGDVGLGKLAFAASLVSIFGVIVPLGTTTVLIKEIARDRDRTGELLRAVLCLRIPLAVVMMGLAVGSVSLMGYPILTRYLVLFGGIGFLISTSSEALSAALKGQENLPKDNGTMLIERAVGAILTIAVVVTNSPIWMLAAIAIITSTISFATNYAVFAPLLRSSWGFPSLSTIRSVVVAGLPFLGWGTFQTLYGQIDPLALSFVASDAAAGWYAAAFRLVGTTLFLPGAMSAALMPTLSRLHREDAEQFRGLARRMLSLVLLCGVPIALVLICAPKVLLDLLHYPASFAASIPVLRIGGVGVLLWYVACVIGTTVVASDGQMGMFRAAFVTAFVSVPACFAMSYLSHRFWGNGAIGAIASDIVTECLLLGFYVRLLPKGFFDRESVFLVGKLLLASVPMCVCLLNIPGTNGLIIGLIGGSAAYLLLCWLLGCLDPRQLGEMLRGVVAKRRAPAPEAVA